MFYNKVEMKVRLKEAFSVSSLIMYSLFSFPLFCNRILGPGCFSASPRGSRKKSIGSEKVKFFQSLLQKQLDRGVHNKVYGSRGRISF